MQTFSVWLDFGSSHFQSAANTKSNNLMKIKRIYILTIEMFNFRLKQHSFILNCMHITLIRRVDGLGVGVIISHYPTLSITIRNVK